MPSVQPDRRAVDGRDMPFVVLVSIMISLMSLSVRAASAEAQTTAPIVLGANSTGMGSDMGPSLDAFAARTGVTPQIAMFYRDWYTGWKTALLDPRFIKPVTDRGAVPMITWEPYLNTGGLDQPNHAPARIAAGDHDAYVRRSAREAKAFGQPFFLRFAHEMNGPWMSWGGGVNGNEPADFVAAWRHVVDIFQAEGATNVRWVWSPNVSTPSNTVPSFEPFFPGDGYVDWVALDGYNWGAHKGSGWRSLSEVFAGNYDSITRLSSKPVMIAETAAPEAGGDKAAWIRQGLLRDLPARMPRVRAVVWFDRDKETDWRVDSSAASLEAFRAVAASPLYAGSGNALAAEPLPPQANTTPPPANPPPPPTTTTSPLPPGGPEPPPALPAPSPTAADGGLPAYAAPLSVQAPTALLTPAVRPQAGTVGLLSARRAATKPSCSTVARPQPRTTVARRVATRRAAACRAAARRAAALRAAVRRRGRAPQRRAR